MADPRSPGRMIRKDASNSKKLARLSPRSLALFGMMIPHFDAYGKMNGDPLYIKSEVVPLIPWLTLGAIRKALAEIDRETNVKWFQNEGRWYLHSLAWEEHQDIRKDRRGKDSLPSYGIVPDESGSSPGVVRPEVKGSRNKYKEKLRTAAPAGGDGAPRATAPPKDPGRGNGSDHAIPPELQKWSEELAVKAAEKQRFLGIDPEAET